MAPVLLFAVFGCGPTTDTSNTSAGSDTGVVGDELPPTITHEPVSSPQSASGTVLVTATIVDPDGILVAGVQFRTQTDLAFRSRAMIPLGDDVWQISLTPDDLQTAGMHYYIEAVDNSGLGSTQPDAAPTDYYRFDLVD